MEKKLLALTLKVDLVEELLKYLASKPYSESAGFINAIQQSTPVFEAEKEKE